MEYTKGEWTTGQREGEYSHWVDIGMSQRITVVNKANAQLIASAPDLYEALKELVGRDEYGSIRLPTQALDIMKKAIAKAEGETN